jgi:P27 family predicted phage terminase small subunit
MARGRAPKADVVDRRKWQDVTVAHKKTGYFDPPAGLNAHALEVWHTYWDDPVSDIAASVDKSLIHRWIKLVNFYYQLVEAYEDMPVTYDDRSRMRPNVQFTMATQVLKHIENAEAQLGIGPKNRVNLGITLATAARSLDAINNEYEGVKVETNNEPKRVRSDPRLSHIVGVVESQG